MHNFGSKNGHQWVGFLAKTKNHYLGGISGLFPKNDFFFEKFGSISLTLKTPCKMLEQLYELFFENNC